VDGEGGCTWLCPCCACIVRVDLYLITIGRVLVKKKKVLINNVLARIRSL
jgi:hypothetical protein